MNRVARTAYWTTPSLFCLALYWLGLKTWFHQDDFAWLNLSLHVHNWRDLVEALFTPRSFGTIRPLSERGFFLAFYSIFGLNALPFHIAVFATQFANLVLVSSIVIRLTGSRLAGFLAPVFWTANGVLAVALSWTSAYNQVLCAFFLLLSLHLLMRYAETGKRGYWIGQWISFLTGFGVLEVNVVYPVLAASYALLFARRHFRKTLWLFLPSVVYGVAHLRLAPKPSSGVYALHLDTSILTALKSYWTMALGPSRIGIIWANVEWMAVAGTALLTVLLLGFVAWSVWKKRWGVAFPLLWFLAVMGPFLPFSAHVSEYYLTASVAGLAMLGAWAFARGFHAGWSWRFVALIGAAVYLAASLPLAHRTVEWHYERGLTARNLVRGIARAAQLHPGKVILLTGVDTDLFWAGIVDKPFRLLGLKDVYLAPGAEGNIGEYPELGNVSDYVLPSGPALAALDQNRAVVYAAGGSRLRNVTGVYRALARSKWPSPGTPRRVDAGNPLFQKQLGPSWYPLERDYRWMPKQATVRLGGPAAGQKLYIAGFCPDGQLKAGPLTLTVSVEGQALPPAVIDTAGAFERSFPLPQAVTGTEDIAIALEVDRTFIAPPETRPLGLVFGTFAIR